MSEPGDSDAVADLPRDDVAADNNYTDNQSEI
jgi:hypothetical protein